MSYLGVLKRVVPFFVTFAAGLFIASFFVSIAAPSFNFQRRGKGCREVRQLRYELERVRRENTDLRKQLEEAGRVDWSLNAVPAPPPFEADAPPPPPPPPRKLGFSR